MSELARQLIAENKRTQNTSLDLGNCGLTEMPEELFDCVWLEKLILSNRYWCSENREWIESNNEGKKNKLSAIPLKLTRLQKIRTLKINGDDTNSWSVSDISIIKYLPELRSLNLSYNQISDINIIETLTELRTLDISYNQISDINIIGNLIGLRTLDLSSNKIKDISIIRTLAELQTLDLSYNHISDINIIGNLTNLKILYLGYNQISNINIIKNLVKLQSLDLSSNSISNIIAIGHLTKLQRLYLGSNKITDYGIIGNLTVLQTLLLSNSKISDITIIGSLIKLQSLYLAANEITDISLLKNLTGLQTLDLNFNQITDINIIGTLTGLQTLDLGSNQIMDINIIGNLTELQALNLSSNKITDFSVIRNLTKLQSLHLGFNKIKSINFVETLTGLKSLYLRSNKISNINSLSKLSNLTTLLLNDNRIENIFPLISFLNRAISPMTIVMKAPWITQEGEINVEGNPLITPPVEIVRQGNEAILNYFNELEKQGIEHLYEAKMLIIGQPRAGKTSLRYKLFDINSELPGEEKTTRGIDIEQLDFDILDKDGKLRKFKYNIWDFGGQQIYQTTHQFFLTNRSLYVLVMDAGKDSIGNDDTTINYWLQVVEVLGGNSPLLLIKNEKNERQVNIDLPQKRTRFSFLKNDYGVDLNALIPGTVNFKETRQSDFKKLKEDIETELRRLPLVGYPMPKNWVRIREELQKLSKKFAHISRQKYIQLCNQFGVKDFEKQMELSRIFHDLGVFLHFQDYEMLEEFIILQNVWATDAVFAVLDNEEVKKNKGRFTNASLPKIWCTSDYNLIIHKKLLALMMQFELCYKISKGNETVYIVPELLDDKAPEGYEWNADNDLVVYYRYDFMPKGLLTRLIVRLHPYIDINNTRQSVWKTGLKINGKGLDYANTFAELTEAWDNKQLLIRTQGVFPKDLMSKITFQVDLLNNEFFKPGNESDSPQKSRWYKMVPCNCSACEQSNEKHFYEYNELMERKEYGKSTIECKKRPYHAANIDELLGGVFTNKKEIVKTSGIKNKPTRIFISYAHKDEKWKDKLVSNLSSLRNQELMVDWEDRQIEAGDWNTQIAAAMNKSDIFLLLITQNFLSSTYITSKEIENAYSKYKAGEAKIFPIICDACDWQLQPVTKSEKEMHPMIKKEMYVWLGKFQSFPKDGKPIKNWTNQQNGFMDVINQLKKYL